MVLIPIRDKSKLFDDDIVEVPQADAVVRQKELLRCWEPQSEVWSLKYGGVVLAGLSAFSSLMINSMFRHKLKLHSHGRIFTALSAIFGPGMVVAALHEIAITERIMIYEYHCPLCLELKSSLIVTAGGLLYPLLALPAINIAIAGNLGLRIPLFTDFREVGKFWWNVVKPGIRHMALFSVCNSIAASYITYKQILTAENIGNILLQIEENYKETAPLET